MKQLVPALIALSLSATPLAAEEATKTPEEGFSLIEEGAKIILRSMIDEMKPALDDAQKGFSEALKEWEPALRDLLAQIDDLSAYEPPVILPNGDILIRKKRELIGPPMPDRLGPNGETDL